MSKQKYTVSSLSMIMILFLVSSYMYVSISDLTFFTSSNFSNDFVFLLISSFIIIVVALVAYVFPMILVFEFNLNLKVNISPTNQYYYQFKRVYIILKNESRRYLRLNVIRCWFSVISPKIN